MKKNLLSPDELGEKGESRFKEICADAQLICNKSDRDRAGWDFIIDFPYEDQKELSLDNRMAPSSCHVQIKTIYASTKSVRLKLNMAERLAKEPKPSFVFVIKVTEDLAVSEAYLIHLLGDRLASVLKRLRKETASGTSIDELNKRFISFTPSHRERVEPTGVALREALQKACETNPHAYAQKKRDELGSLGFDGHKFEGRMVMTARDRTELADIFLGIRQSVPVENLETFENRFDIKIRDLPPQAALVTIKPEPFDRVKVVVRGADGLPPAVFEADLFVVPKFVTGEEGRMHLRSHLFQIDLFQSTTGVRPQFHFDILSKQASPDVWWSYWRTLRAFSDNRGVIEITPNKLKGMMQLGIVRADAMPAHGFDTHLELCDRLTRIFKFSGLGSAPDFEWAPIESELPQIAMLDRLVQGSFESFSSSSDFNPALQIFDGQQMIVANKFAIADRYVAYYALATVAVTASSEQSTLELSNFVYRRAALVSRNEEAFHEFLDDAKSVEGIEALCNMQMTE